MKKAKEYRDMSIDELDAAYHDKCKEKFHLVNQLKHDKKLEKPHMIVHTRKEIARLLTVKNEKLNAQKQS